MSQVHSVDNKRKSAASEPALLTAELFDSNLASACGITVRSFSPVLALCRELIAAGVSHDAALTVYRNGIVALRVRSIGEGAQLEINSKGTRFVRTSAVRTASPMRKNAQAEGAA